jgi:hypothetical protein
MMDRCGVGGVGWAKEKSVCICIWIWAMGRFESLEDTRFSMNF